MSPTRVTSTNMWILEENEFIEGEDGKMLDRQVLRVFEYDGPLIAIQGIIEGLGEGRIELEGTEADFAKHVQTKK